MNISTYEPRLISTISIDLHYTNNAYVTAVPYYNPVVEALPPMLREAGIPVALGFDAANLEPRPDLVVVGNAVTLGLTSALAYLKWRY